MTVKLSFALLPLADRVFQIVVVSVSELQELLVVLHMAQVFPLAGDWQMEQFEEMLVMPPPPLPLVQPPLVQPPLRQVALNMVLAKQVIIQPEHQPLPPLVAAVQPQELPPLPQPQQVEVEEVEEEVV